MAVNEQDLYLRSTAEKAAGANEQDLYIRTTAEKGETVTTTTSTTTTTTTTAPPFQDDDFDDESIAAFWTLIEIDCTIEEVDDGQFGAEGTLLFTSTDAPGTGIAWQTSIEGDFDLYYRLYQTLDDELTVTGCIIYADYYGAGEVDGWVLSSYRSDDPADIVLYGHNTDPDWSFTTVGLPADDIWYRLKRASGVVTGYYAATEPIYENDWTQLSQPAVTYENSDPVDIGVYFQSQTDAVIGEFDFIKAWVATPTTTTTTTTTTSPTIIDIDTDEDIHDEQTGVVITGSGFETESANSRVRINSQSDGLGTDSVQTDTSWAKTSIDFTVVKGSLSYGTNYLFVRNKWLLENAVGFTINLYDYLNITGIDKAFIRSGQTVEVQGEGFGASQGSSIVQLMDTSDGSGVNVTQTVDLWGETGIDITVVQGALDPDDSHWIRVQRNQAGQGDSGARNSNSVSVDLREALPFKLTLTTWFINKEVTTDQLTAPTGIFRAGQCLESSNPGDQISLLAEEYTEIEFCIQAQTESEAGVQYEFRLTDNGSAIGAYTKTPKVTIAP